MSSLELEKASSQAKDNRIKSLEEIIIELRVSEWTNPELFFFLTAKSMKHRA